jgi:ornithine cyclodeaminase/alanine dehydrogenase-like protein (mu-crystallin family)
MGADTMGKRELTAQVLERSDVIADVPGEALRVGESAYLPEERRNSVMSLARCLTATDYAHREHEFLVVDSVGSSYVDAAVTSVIMSRAVDRGVGHEISW